MAVEYEGFDLLVEQIAGQDYRLSPLDSPGSEVRVEKRFPFDELALENRPLSPKKALLRSCGVRRWRRN